MGCQLRRQASGSAAKYACSDKCLPGPFTVHHSAESDRMALKCRSYAMSMASTLWDHTR